MGETERNAKRSSRLVTSDICEKVYQEPVNLAVLELIHLRLWEREISEYGNWYGIVE